MIVRAHSLKIFPTQFPYRLVKSLGFDLWTETQLLPGALNVPATVSL